MLKNVFSGLVLATALGAAQAESPQALCLHANGTPEETKCLSAELAKSDQVLGEYLKVAQERINQQNAGKPQLAASQAEWLRYRSAQCGDVYTYEVAGTYRYRAELECEIEATRARTHDVWSAYMRTFGSSTPIRPEP
jgi:uncharacterized protein YecT (DUF1311 family)